MYQLNVSLFGKIKISLCTDPSPLIHIEGHKTQELLCYLLLHRDRAHTREALATLLWHDVSLTQSKGYLRKALWKLQSTLDSAEMPLSTGLLLVSAEWIQVNPDVVLWLDVAEFEQAYAQVQGVPGREMDEALKREVCRAVTLYHDDLLEGWYQEWCLFERERLQRMYLIMLDKLMNFCEAQQKYEDGLTYGMRILKQDRARERTHRRLMRLYYLDNNRTEALRQYGRCVEILDQDLGVKPSRRTMALYEEIRFDRLLLSNGQATAVAPVSQPLLQTLSHLQALQHSLVETQRQLQHDMEVIETTLTRLAQEPPHMPPP